jgi:hypothetical protein
MFCVECGKPLTGSSPRFCSLCGHPVQRHVDPRVEAAPLAEESPSPNEPAPFDGKPLAADGYPDKNSDWSLNMLNIYRMSRRAIGPASELTGLSVERRWIVSTDDLPRQFPDLPDIGYCVMLGDGNAIPSSRDWPKKYLKKGFPLETLPNSNTKCPRRAVTRWCHVMLAMNSARTGTIPTQIVKFVDTCVGHSLTFSIPNTPSLGRGPSLKVGSWQRVSFDAY